MSKIAELLAEFERRTERAWMPMRVFRTNEEAAADEVRHEVWQEATELVRECADAMLAAREGNAK